LGNQWNVASFFSENPEEVWGYDTRPAENHMVLNMVAMAFVAALMYTLRSCVFWIPVMLGWLLFAAVLVAVGSPFPDTLGHTMFVTFFLFCLACVGVWRNERHMRHQWLTSIRLQESEEVITKKDSEILSTTEELQKERTIVEEQKVKIDETSSWCVKLATWVRDRESKIKELSEQVREHHEGILAREAQLRDLHNNTQGSSWRSMSVRLPSASWKKALGRNGAESECWSPR